jgi:hypothetical protein
VHKNKKRVEGGSLFNRTVGKAIDKFKDMSSESQQAVSRGIADKLIKKSGVTKELTQRNLKKYCVFVESMISAVRYDSTGTGLGKIRMNILNNLPKDIEELFSGKQRLYPDRLPTQEEVFNFYWDVKEFQDVWGKLTFSKELFEGMVLNAKTKIEKESQE